MLKRGQAKFIETVFIIAFGFFILTTITAFVYSFYRNVITNEAQQGIKEIALITSQNILQIYELGKKNLATPDVNKTIFLSEINLNLPTYVARRNYEVILISPTSLFGVLTNLTVDGRNTTVAIVSSSPKIIARTTQDPIVSVEQDIPSVDITLQGRSGTGLNSKLRYYRTNFNGTVFDSIVLGDVGILINYTQIS